MNAGFSNLATLKQNLLAASMQSDTSFDAAIAAIGLGIAGRVGTLLNRKLQRAVGVQEIFPADRINFLLARYPLEAITTIELKMTDALGWVTQDTSFYNTIDLANGIVMLPDGCDAGPYFAQVRFTFTGGFWWPVLDDDDDNFPDTLPTGANALPPDIQQAWLLQCQQVWSDRDKLGIALTDKPETQARLADLKLIPEVRAMLAPYVRYQMV